MSLVRTSGSPSVTSTFSSWRMPAEADQRVGAVPVDGVAVALAPLRVLQQSRDEVDAGLDGDREAGLQREVDAQPREVVGDLAPGQRAAGVADAEADQVPEPVREEERDRTGLHQ